MNLWFRLLAVLLRARFGRSLGMHDTSVVPFRVWPTDLDPNVHMNNGRYATLMDLGRIDLMARARMLGRLRAEGMYPVVTAQHILYRRSLDPFQAFRLETRLIGVDDRFAYMEQCFWVGDTLHARGIAQALFLRTSGGRVSVEDTMRVFGIANVPTLPDEVAAMFPPPPTDASTRQHQRSDTNAPTRQHHED